MRHANLQVYEKNYFAHPPSCIFHSFSQNASQLLLPKNLWMCASTISCRKYERKVVLFVIYLFNHDSPLSNPRFHCFFWHIIMDDSFFWHLVMEDISCHCLFCYYLLLFLFFIIKQWLQRVFGCLIINWLAQNSVRIHAPPPPPPSKNKKTKKTGICNKY